jgi:SpoVK/Ycf46/Vps4 family AAA+-type ATPase
MERENSRDYLTFYARPDEAGVEERLVARMAVQMMAAKGELPGTSFTLDPFIMASGRLLVWSRAIITALGKPCLGARETRDLEKLPIGAGDIQAEYLVRPDRWEEMDWQILLPVMTKRRLRRRLITDTMKWIDSAAPTEYNVERNVGYLADALALTAAERAVLLLVAVARGSDLLRDLMRTLPGHNIHTVSELLSRVLGIPGSEIKRAFGPEGPLRRLSLIAPDLSGDMEDFVVRAENERVYAAIQGIYPDASAFLGSFLRRAPQALVSKSDCAHLEEQLDVARRLMRSALEGRERGIHVLLYGPAGTGKTECARLLAADVGAVLYEVDHEDRSGGSANQAERFSSLMLGGQFLGASGKSLLLFDEAEDAFPEDHAPRWLNRPTVRRMGYAKAWMNRLLETLPVPVIWTSNSIEGMDAAFLRRFSLHIRFPELPKQVKLRLAERYLPSPKVGQRFRDEIAGLSSLTPGQLQTAARVAELCRPSDGPDTERIVQMQLGAARRAAGLDNRRAGIDLAIPYSEKLIHLRPPMTVDMLRHGLATHPRAAVCLYGLPGTGKTQLAHHLGDELGREVLQRSASDLLSPWVGMTEKLIAGLFEEAEERASEVIVLLDEADSFLRDRAGARASWEMTQTNEFLSRMERFPGIFICTTNLVASLDPAVLRRFQFRIECLPLRPEQAANAFVSTFGREPAGQQWGRLAGDLVPADFANVARQLRFLENAKRVEPVLLLAEEVRARQGMQARRGPLGFAPGV